MLARACGKTNVHSLEPEDLCALTVEAAAMAKVPLAAPTGSGRHRGGALAKIERLLEKHLEYPVDYLPAEPADSPGRRLAGRSRPARDASGHRLRVPVGQAACLPGGHLPLDDVDLVAATPGEDINWLEDVELLEEDGVPAVFDRYSNSFLKIYFPDSEARRTRSPARCSSSISSPATRTASSSRSSTRSSPSPS